MNIAVCDDESKILEEITTFIQKEFPLNKTEAFSDGQEMLIFVTDLTASSYAAQFIAHYGCPEYFKHNKELLLYERQLEIVKELEVFDLN